MTCPNREPEETPDEVFEVESDAFRREFFLVCRNCGEGFEDTHPAVCCGRCAYLATLDEEERD